MSTIKTNTLTGTTSAGSILVTGEGGSTTTNLQQGLIKQWDKFNQETPAVLDSFNLSSLTDRTTGKTQHNFTNGMSNANYSVTGMALDEDESQAVMDGCDDDFTDSSKYEVNTFETSNTPRDCDHGYTMICGDLA
tara:strand:+ start:148 stop:552 length:405 start_codon:yes stop_codon:yes gene_type:complete